MKDEGKIEEYSREIEEAQETLKKYRQALKEVTSATKTILSASVKKSVYQQLENIEEEYNAKKAALEERVSSAKKKVTDKVKDVKEGMQEVSGVREGISEASKAQREKNAKFKEKQLSRNEEKGDSGFLATRIKLTKAVSDARTFFGSISARVAKQPYTLAARWEAVKGDKAKREEFIEKAEKLVSDIQKGVASKNKEAQGAMQKKVTRRGNIETRAKNQAANIDRIKEGIDSRESAWQEENSHSKGARTVVARTIARIDKTQGKAYTVAARVGQKSLTSLARAMSNVGMDKAADRTSKAAGKISRNAMSKASSDIASRHKEFNERVSAYDSVTKNAKSSRSDVDARKEEIDRAGKEWKTQDKPGNFLRGTINGISKGAFAIGRFKANSRTSVYEFAAHTQAALGNTSKAKELMQKAQMKSERTMDRVDAFNESARNGMDGVIDFSQRAMEGAKELRGKAARIGKQTIEFGVGAAVLTAQAISNKASDTRDKVSLRYQKSKQGLLSYIRDGAKGVVGKMEKSLEVSEMAASKAQERIDARRENSDPGR